MSGAISATAIVAGAAVAGTAYSVYSGRQQKKAQSAAQNEARANALKQEKMADEATNRANQKKPDTMAILDAASQAGKAGMSGTMLTGPQGVSSDAMSLGRSTLLGS
jgi:uncharacterized protein HemX